MEKLKKYEPLMMLLTLILMVFVAAKLTLPLWWHSAAPQQEAKAVRLEGMYGEPSYGPAKAPYTVVVFSDYKCPFCKKAEEKLMPEIVKLAKAEKLRYYYEDFPLPMHKGADEEARYGRCAYFAGIPLPTVHKAIFLMNKLPTWEDRDVQERINACMDKSYSAADIQASIKRGQAAGVQGTPTFIIGKTIAGGVDGKMYVGADIDLKSLIKQ